MRNQGNQARRGPKAPVTCTVLAAALLTGGCVGLVAGNSGGGNGGAPTPLSISGVAASNATITGVLIGWQTNVAANSQVEYGTTASYGATTPLDSTMAMSHQVTLVALKSGTTYHFRVDSTDANNNTAKSNDLTFTTLPDNVAPMVSITSPQANATVAGTVIVTASASDDVAVSRVQFAVDAANTGSPANSVPYSYSLDTRTLSNGNHTLTAVATDTSGNTATSSGILLKVNNLGPAPSITSLSPTSGVAGTPVTITGVNFGATQGTSTVKFNGVAATPTSWSATSIVTPVPAGATSGNVVVTVGGAGSNGAAFTVTVPVPRITSLSPTSGVVGTPVTITGVNFGATQGTSTVKFNGVAATPTSWSATSIVTPVPTGATSGNVVVTVGGVASNGATFTLQADTTVPVVTMTGPANGATVSGRITLSATATDPDSAVSFVQFRVDGTNVGAQLTAAPYSISFDSTTIANGSHTFTAVAQDPSANQGVSAGEVITISNSTGTGVVPTLVQSKVDAAEGNPFSFFSRWKSNLPNPAQGGNCLIAVVVAGNSGASLSVSDDQGNAWNGPLSQIDNAGNRALLIFYAMNVAAGTRAVTVSGFGQYAYNQVMLLEYNNVAATGALDVQTGQVTSGTNLASGTMTTTMDGDLILEIGYIDELGQTAPMTWTAGSGYTFAATSDTNYMAVQYQVQSAQGAINPTMTSSINSGSAITKAIALKASSVAQGSPNASGIRVRKVDIESLGVTPYGNYGSGTTWTFQFQVDGNLIATGWTGNAAHKLTSVTSNPSLSWSSTPSTSDSGGSGNSVQWWYAAGAVPGTLYTITFNGSTPNSFTVNLFDISGAAALPFDTFANSSGNNPSHPSSGETGVLVDGPLLTPSTANGLVLAVQQEDQHTIVNASPGYFEGYDVGVYSGPSGEGDQGLMAYYNPDTSAVQVVWNYSGYESGVSGIGAYCSQAIAFKPAP